jgi:hypothetical protein
MPYSETLRHVVLVRTDVSEERITTIIRVARIGALCSAHQLLVIVNAPILVTLMMEALRSSET